MDRGRPVRVGVDIGGTFTDLVLQRADGGLVFHKRLTTPHDLARGLAEGVRELLERAAVKGDAVTDVLHATTLGSNVVIERRGVPTGLITTRGFRDVLEIQRSLRYNMYDVLIEKPRPLIQRSRVWEVTERALADGSIRTPLVEAEVAAIAEELKRLGIESVAVGFLHAYANPTHERLVRDLLADLAPDVLVTLSSDVSSQAREYERLNTAVVNAYISPIFQGYVRQAETELRKRGVKAPLRIMQSSGGMTSGRRAAAMPVRTIESGPAAGALMAARHGRLAGHEHVLAFDMGGTTAKMTVIRGGRPKISRHFEIDRVEMRDGSGLPLDIPAIDLIEIGAGGGSIASCVAGVLRVGPRSAGAEPGPVCYGRGGTEPTLTDACLVLGYLNPDYFAGGAIKLDVAAAEAALARLGQAVGLDAVRTAWSVYELATFEMERAIRLISVDKGLDPRDFAMVCFGGAGPAHGCRLARSLGIGRVVFPAGAGVGSAVGLVESDESVELARTLLLRLDEAGARAEARRVVRELEAQARDVASEAWAAAESVVRLAVGMRYVGQAHELEVEFDGGRLEPDDLASCYGRAYEQVYGYTEASPVEAVTWYCTVARQTSRAREKGVAGEGNGAAGHSALKGRRRVYRGDGDLTDVPVFDRYKLVPGVSVTGPAVIEERHTTVVLLSEDTASVDAHLNLIVEVGGRRGNA